MKYGGRERRKEEYGHNMNNIREKELIIFDLDGTLAPSKSPLEPDMADLLVRLISKKKVAVISGGGYPQFETQFLKTMPISADNYSNLILLPTSGTRMYLWRGAWCEQYAEHLSPHEKEKILTTLNLAFKSGGYVRPEKTYGPIIEDRGSQITFSALGQSAPLLVKSGWDPSREKREKIAGFLRDRLPEFDVRIGGTTSIDITKRGINKSYGIRKLEQFLKIDTDKMLFVGDALFQGGNDYPVKATGIDCIQVNGTEDTKKLIFDWLASP